MSALTLRTARLAARRTATAARNITSRRTMATMREHPLSEPAERIKSTIELAPGWVKSSMYGRSHLPSEHPFVRNPAPADWGRIFRTRATTLAMFFPLMGMALGWPYAAKSVLDGHIE